MLREFTEGFRLLARGFGMWRAHPRLLAWGLWPAIVAGALLLAALIPLFFWTDDIAAWSTPFAERWGVWRDLLRAALGFVIVVAAIALAGAVFVALALTIGDPFYQRIWRGVEQELGGAEPVGGTGFWATVREGIRLVVLGLLLALLTLALGFIPLVGGFLATVTGTILSGRLLARELTGRAFDARGLDSRDRSTLLRTRRARVLGFGVATQLCFLVPLGAIVTMPAAVAGSTILARSLTEEAAAPRA